MAEKVLVVCTGNTCRSPMAEVLLRHGLKEKGLGDVEVISAGLGALEGMPAAEEAKMVVGKKGMSLGEHCSRPVNDNLLNEAHLILTMTMNQRDRIIALSPGNKDKVFTLKELASGEKAMALMEKLEALDELEDKQLEELGDREELKALEGERERLERELAHLEDRIRRVLEKRREVLSHIYNRRKELMVKLRELLDVEDPFGGDMGEYERIFGELEEYVAVVVEKLENEKRRRKDGDSE